MDMQKNYWKQQSFPVKRKADHAPILASHILILKAF
jgi:hypothetical protein